MQRSKKGAESSESLSLREIVKKISVGNGQNCVRCYCKGICQNKKCNCFKANMWSNSACHSNQTSENQYDNVDK